MKKISTLLAVLATAAAAFAQPTFSGAALQPFIGQDINFVSSTYTGTSAAPVVTPPICNGTNFDFTTYTWPSPSVSVIPPVLPASPYATHYETGYSDNISATKALTTYSLLTKIDATGVKAVGWSVDSFYFSLTGTTRGLRAGRRCGWSHSGCLPAASSSAAGSAEPVLCRVGQVLRAAQMIFTTFRSKTFCIQIRFLCNVFR